MFESKRLFFYHIFFNFIIAKKKEDISGNLCLPNHYSHSPKKKNNNYRVTLSTIKFNLSTTKTSVEYCKSEILFVPLFVVLVLIFIYLWNNIYGEAIGIVSSIMSQSGGFEGLGFAVTSNTAKKLLLEEPTPWSVVQGYLHSDEIAGIFNLPQSSGLLLQRVATGSPAYKAKLREGSIDAVVNGQSMVLGGDIILSVDGIQIDGNKSILAIREKLREASKGKSITVSVLRASKVFDVSVDFSD